MLVDVDDYGALREVLDRLGDIEPDDLSDGAVHRTLVGLVEATTVLHAVTTRFAHEWDRRQTWTTDGSRSATSRLARETNSTRQTAARIIGRARAVAHMPAAAEAFALGHINTDHIDLLRLANRGRRRYDFARDEAQLVEYCRLLPLPEADVAIRYWIARVDANVDPDGPEPLIEDRTATWTAGINGDKRIDATLDPVAGAVVIDELERLDNQLRHADANDPTSTRTRAQRRADALVEMAMRSAATAPDAKRPRIAVTVAVGDKTFQRLCELSDGTIIKPAHLAHHRQHLDINTIIYDGPFHAIAASPSRTFTGALRRAIEIRDRHCQHPAGDHDPIRNCDVDHIVPVSQGGITCQCNGQLMSTWRNRHPHAHRLTATDITIDRDDPVHLATHARLQALQRQPRAG